MFDTINYTPRGATNQTVNSNIRVTEKRAPTDESIRLLREMEETALSNVIFRKALKLDNDFNIDVFVFREFSMYSPGVTIAVVAKVNGKECKETRSIHEFEMSEEAAVDALKECINAIIVKNSIEKVGKMFDEIMKSGGFK